MQKHTPGYDSVVTRYFAHVVLDDVTFTRWVGNVLSLFQRLLVAWYVFLCVKCAGKIASLFAVAWLVSSDEDSAPIGRVKACAVKLQGTTVLQSALLTYRIHNEGDSRFKYDYNHRGLLLHS